MSQIILLGESWNRQKK